MRALSIIASALAAALVAPAALAQTAPAPGVAAFDGVWERVGAITFDPTLKAGALDQPPYNAEYAARYQALLDAAKAGRPVADPTASCVFAGMPRLMNLAMPMEIAVIPGKVFIMAEWNSEVRRIYTDGRPQPADPDPTYNGHSIGRWDKDQLLVDTVGLRDDTNFAASGAPHSDAMQIHERFWMTAPDTLKDEITVDDPKAFVKPWTVVKTFRRQPTWEIQEYVCADNNRNPVENNVTGALLTPPKK